MLYLLLITWSFSTKALIVRMKCSYSSFLLRHYQLSCYRKKTLFCLLIKRLKYFKLN